MAKDFQIINSVQTERENKNFIAIPSANTDNAKYSIKPL